MIVNELRGEKIDIVPFSEEPEEFVSKALSPAKVQEVRIDLDTGTADVIVPDYQLSLAIGKEGQNARLSARLTGWRIDIKSETQQAEEDAYQSVDWAEGEWVEDPKTGEQVWQPAEGGPALSAEEWEATSETEPEDSGPDMVEGAEPSLDSKPEVEESNQPDEAIADEAGSNGEDNADDDETVADNQEPGSTDDEISNSSEDDLSEKA
jgi:N utilization substance protein A